MGIDITEGENYDEINLKMVWSGYLQGYFFVKYSESGNKLVFWDTKIPTQGENLKANSEDIKEEASAQMKALRERAEQLNKKYGVDIRLGDECQLDYSNYSAACFENVQSLTDALNLLEKCFDKYPKGFFEQLQYGSITSIQIELVRALTPKDENNQDAAGFDYAYSYTNIPESVKKHYGSGYFTESYSCTFPTEDRATMMESAMAGHEHIFEAMPKLAAKLRYYSKCIRDCFDTTGWPEETTWEACLP